MAEQPLSARRQVVTLVAMCVAQGMILLDNTIVNVALPSIQRELDVDPGNLIWVVNAYVLAHHGRGTLGDRYGGKRVFLVGLAIFTAMSAACALSPNESVLSPLARRRASARLSLHRLACRFWLTPTRRSVARPLSESGLLPPGWGSVPGRSSAAFWSNCSPGRPCFG